MYRAISNSFTGIKAFQGGVDQVADNVANVNTTGFNSSRASFSDLVYRELAERRIPVNPEGEVQGGKGSRVSSVITSFEQGTLEQTGRPLDVAIEGDGFFRVIGPDGGEAYIRQGSFYKDADGNLTIASGELLDTDFTLEEIPLDSVSISQEGEVYTEDEDGERTELGQIETYTFNNPDGLEKVENGLYLESETSGEPRAGSPGEEGRGTLQQYFLESSNVDISREMAELIKMQRALESSARSVSTANELWVLALQAKR